MDDAYDNVELVRLELERMRRALEGDVSEAEALGVVLATAESIDAIYNSIPDDGISPGLKRACNAIDKFVSEYPWREQKDYEDCRNLVISAATEYYRLFRLFKNAEGKCDHVRELDFNIFDTEDRRVVDDAYRPAHYRDGTADMCDAIVDGLPAARAAALWNVLKYYERAGKKGDIRQDLEKANNYAFRAVFGKFRYEIENVDDD